VWDGPSADPDSLSDSETFTITIGTVTAPPPPADPVAELAYALDQQYGFEAAASEYVNFRGANEKYFRGSDGSWYFVLPEGEVYQWGGSIAGSTLLGELSRDYYDDLSLIYDAQPVDLESVDNVFDQLALSGQL
jgi:hypothetical protein